MAHPRAMAAWTHVRTPIRRADRGKAFIKVLEADSIICSSIMNGGMSVWRRFTDTNDNYNAAANYIVLTKCQLPTTSSPPISFDDMKYGNQKPVDPTT
ncbi:Os07g0145600 [Oryza sativa Japonica Group]|uniref:Os07g0145600 protein n=1 Tax=Oryza sativa subsp. japonica TaxID=39947 RepID=A0A0P0X2N0_ORYSJ|nr:Os07g0145600 [Oryza sativa Japonica Group]